jgi:dCMP deaminase
MGFLLNGRPMAKWDERFCELARYVSRWSKDPNAKVGAVLFANRGGDISIGYNGFPMGVEDTAERLEDKQIKLEMIVHAEENAVLAAGGRAKGSTVFVWGKPVCARCAASMIQAGVKRVVAEEPEEGRDSHWDRSGRIALEMFKEANVQADLYMFEEEPIERPPSIAVVTREPNAASDS